MVRNLIRLSDLNINQVEEIFEIADKVESGQYKEILKGKTFVMFFPASSIRTRITFEKAIYLLGGQSILFDPGTLDKKEAICDVIGYLNNWVDGLIIRYPDINMIENISTYAKMPIINAMTDINHPCEMLSDLYTLSKIREDYRNCKYLYVGPAGNIGYAWKESAKLFGFPLTQCSPLSYKMDNVNHSDNIREAIKEKDIICTDSIKKEFLSDFNNYQIDEEIMKLANKDAILNPCPPFYRGEEVSEGVINSKYFAGYEFKKSLLCVQMAIIIYLIKER